MIYKVRVKCFGERPNFPKKSKQVECEMSCLVDEPTTEQASVAGVAYVECNAPADVRWHDQRTPILVLPFLRQGNRVN